MQKTIGKLEKGEHHTCRRLIFFSRNKLVKGEDLRASLEPTLNLDIAAIYESLRVSPSGSNQGETVYHELRHIFDNIIGCLTYDRPHHFVETQAEMANFSVRGVKRDRDKCKEITLLELSGESVFEVPREEVDRCLRSIDTFYSECHENLQRIPTEHWRKLSYAVSVTNAHQGPELFRALAEHYEP